MSNSLIDTHGMQYDSDKKYYGTEHLVIAEKELKNYNNWIIYEFLRNVRINSNSKVMDFGAGIGTLSEIFFRATGVKPDCIEIDAEQRNFIEKKGFKSYSRLDEVSKKYDFIFTSNVLEHIKDDLGALSDIKLKLTDSGTLGIFVPAFEIIWSTNDVMIGHERRYTKESMLMKLEQIGFTVKHLRYCDSLGFLITFIFKLIGSKSGGASAGWLRFYDKYLLPISKIMDFLFCRMFGKSIFAIAISN